MGTLINGIKEIFASASQTSPTNIPTCAADGTPNGNITIANLASVLGGQFAGTWMGGSFENMANLTDGRRVYYVDKDANGHSQYDFPFQYCVVSIDKTHWSASRFLIAFAFDILSGQTKIYRDGGGGDRIYNWQDVAIGYPSFYKDYSTLASLASALGAANGQYIGSLADLGQSVASYGFDVRAYLMTCADAPKHNENDGYILTGVTTTSNGRNSYFQIATADNNLYYRFYHGGLGQFIINWTALIQ